VARSPSQANRGQQPLPGCGCLGEREERRVCQPLRAARLRARARLRASSSAGDRPLDLPDLFRLGRRYLAEQVTEGRSLGLQVGAWLARGTGPAALAAACQRLQADRVILSDQLARPSLRDRVLGRTLAAFQARLAAKITLVDNHGAVVDA
jgi:hypothetical protein